MSEPSTTSEPTVLGDGTSQAPSFISLAEIVFSTAAAKSLRPAPFSRRLLDGIRVARAAVQLPPARRRYPQPSRYLEHSRMAREMDRL